MNMDSGKSKKIRGEGENQSCDETSNSSSVSETKSAASSDSAGKIKLMDQKTLDFLKDPANASFLQQILAASKSEPNLVSKK